MPSKPENEAQIKAEYAGPLMEMVTYRAISRIIMTARGREVEIKIQQEEYFDPPSFAEKILLFLTPSGKVEFVIGDLREEYSKIAEIRGVAYARSWYWGQVSRSAVPLLIGTLNVLISFVKKLIS